MGESMNYYIYLSIFLTSKHYQTIKIRHTNEIKVNNSFIVTSQAAITCSKLIIETLEQCVKYV